MGSLEPLPLRDAKALP